MEPGQSRSKAWWIALLVLGAVSAGWFALLLAADYALAPGRSVPLQELLARFNPSDIQQVLGNLPEVVAAVLGIAITVVSIVLQLSATRYTPRVTEMFFRDRTNLVVLSFFVITSLHCFWATFAVHRTFVPRLVVLSALAMMTAAILILIPYFIYVFAFLDPERVVARLQQQSLAQALGRRHTGIAERQARVLAGIEQLADVAVNAISQKDRIIASRSVDALRDLANSYMKHKHQLDPRWFAAGAHLAKNPDLVALASEKVHELGEARTWMEWKVLRQYQTIYNESINRMRDISQLVAIDTRYIGEQSLVCGDRPVLELAIKFFNTYLRATINRQDVRTAYNVLHQYRQLAEAVMRAGWGQEAIQIAGYFKYYGQTANGAGLSFVTETAAYDLCQLCELAHREQFADQDQLLATLLDVDKVPETEAEERSLRGVRKAQIKLATYYLDAEEESRARRIWHDMEHERPERLASIRREMLAVDDRDFWEIIDRGYNFDYLEPRRRELLEKFFAWFPHFDAE